MADAIVSNVLEQLETVVSRHKQQRVKLVGGVDDEVNQLTSNFQAIQAVVLDAEQRQITDAAVRFWLEKLKDVSYDIEDVLDEWRTAILQRLQIKSKVCSNFLLPCSVLRQVDFRHDIASKIKAINDDLYAVAVEKDRYNFKSIEPPPHQREESTSFIDVSEVVGRDELNNALVGKLLCESCEEGNVLHIISILGMGGIGKTTLAQLAYSNDEVIKHFEKRIWVCVSDSFDKLRTAKAILETLEGHASDFSTLQYLLEKISESLRRIKFLIVLDDVWTENDEDWEPFHHCLKYGLHGSKVLVTTRNHTTAMIMKSIDIISIEGLSEEHCWSLFRQLAFFGRSDEECGKLEGIGREIVSKCNGWPLVAKTMGSLLRFKRTITEWKNILYSDMWKLKEFEEGVFPPLLLSYYDLPLMVKRCFTYCAMFPKDFQFRKDELIKLWMAQGYLGLDHNEEIEIIGEECFNSLLMRSFFQEFEKDDDGNIIMCKMHDIVHDVAQYLSKNECCMMQVKDLREGIINALCKKAYQLMLRASEVDTFPISICNFKKLRSLLIQCDEYRVNYLIDEVPPKLFDELLCLRALKISGGLQHIKHIPKEIGQLVHLRYLDLSNNDKLRKLPETLCDLYNLQTLKLDWCEALEQLPQGIGKLINLRYLMNCGSRSLMYMPKGIERLQHLQTLSEFHWSGGYGGKACSLKDLNKVWPHVPLHIKGLGDTTKVIDQIVELKNCKNIHDLSLVFGKSDWMNDEVVLEALQPPPNLEVLTISNYSGHRMFTLKITSLTSLSRINLSECINCNLPPLGKLSSLETLVIESMRSVIEVNIEFLGIGSTHTSSSSSVISFPKLKTLEYSHMHNWEVWDFGIEDDTRIMPSLCSLKIHYCKKLKGLPKQILHKATLENLLIEDCPILEQLYEKGTGENWHDISHIPNILIKR